MTPRAPLGMGEHVQCRSDGQSAGITMHENDISVTGNGSLSSCGEDVLHGRFQVETLYEDTMRKVNKKWRDERSVKFDGSKCHEIVD